MRGKRTTVVLVSSLLVWSFLLGVGTPPAPVRGFDLGGGIGDLIKIFGIGWVVTRFAGDIDRFINSVLGQRGAAIEGMTKVVPVVRVGKGGTAVGAVQVMGPPQQVKKVQAVAEVELGIGRLRGRGLVPIATKTAEGSTLKGVGGVGVSANIKFPI
ncbi:MAG: hypothetical protein N2512_11635 [Armatimonadetes bacterium]|nr:hypothetical protein [Armatimonadota bacterium]